MITRQQLDDVLELQKRDGRRLGTLLAESGYVTETQVTQILSQQLAVPWVSLYHIDFSRPLLNLVPREIAEKYCLVPIFVRRVRGVGETLYVAMDDPSDDRARDEVALFAGLPVRGMIAAPSDIRAAIRAYYARPSLSPESNPSARSSAETVGEAFPVAAAAAPVVQREAAETAVAPPAASAPAGSRSEPGRSAVPQSNADEVASNTAAVPVSQAASATIEIAPASAGRVGGLVTVVSPERSLASAQVTTVGRSAPAGAAHGEVRGIGGAGPAEEGEPDSGIPIPVRESSMPHPKRGTRPRLITLTLLDGTHVTLPARAHPETSARANESSDASSLTARDLVSALRAAAHGADASAVLGEASQWEPLFAALLSLLLKKHLIADWEFVEEFERMKKA
ncbi:MAG: hypothetical protein JW751_04035 [Polyangiaceae bacterium]|nr:hypothetical protein [Polyangiaceae bacterium]